MGSGHKWHGSGMLYHARNLTDKIHGVTIPRTNTSGIFFMHKMLWVAIAGLVGAIIGMFRSKADTLTQRASFVLFGFAAAIFLTPLAARWFGLGDIYEVGGAGFIIGMFWIAILDRVKQAMTDGKLPEVK